MIINFNVDVKKMATCLYSFVLIFC